MGKVSKQLEKKQNVATFVKDLTKCFYCGDPKEKTEADHVKAQSNGGKTIVPACRSCNASKQNKQLMEWLRDVKKTDPSKWKKMCALHKGRKNSISKKIQKVRDE